MFLIINIYFISFLIYNFLTYKPDDSIQTPNLNCQNLYNNKKALYDLFTIGGWKKFQIWYASIANNAWQDILFSILLFTLPFPILPASLTGRINIMLAKLGLYKISLAIVLGNPNYIQYDNFIDNFNTEEKIEMAISLVILSLFVIYIIYEIIKNVMASKTKTINKIK